MTRVPAAGRLDGQLGQRRRRRLTEKALTVPVSSSFTAYSTGRAGCWTRNDGDGVRATTPSLVSAPVAGCRRSSAMPSPSPPLSPV